MGLAHFESDVLGLLPVAGTQHDARQNGRAAEAWQAYHWEFACRLARQQVEQGGRVLFEHPWAAASWNDPCLKELSVVDGMRRV